MKNKQNIVDEHQRGLAIDWLLQLEMSSVDKHNYEEIIKEAFEHGCVGFKDYSDKELLEHLKSHLSGNYDDDDFEPDEMDLDLIEVIREFEAQIGIDKMLRKK